MVSAAPLLQDAGHHQKGVGHLGPAQHEDAGPLRPLHQAGDDAVLLLEQPSHGGGQHLLKAAQGGLVPVGGGEGVAHVQVRQRRQLAHQQGLGLLLVGQLQALLKQGLLLRQKAHIVQQEDLPVPQRLDGRPGGGAAHVVNPLHLPAQQAAQDLGVGLCGPVVLILDVAALVGQQDHPGPPVRQLPDRGHAGLDPLGGAEGPRGPVHRLVDVHPAEDRPAGHVPIVQGTNAEIASCPSFTRRS